MWRKTGIEGVLKVAGIVVLCGLIQIKPPSPLRGGGLIWIKPHITRTFEKQRFVPHLSFSHSAQIKWKPKKVWLLEERFVPHLPSNNQPFSTRLPFNLVGCKLIGCSQKPPKGFSFRCYAAPLQPLGGFLTLLATSKLLLHLLCRQRAADRRSAARFRARARARIGSKKHPELSTPIFATKGLPAGDLFSVKKPRLILKWLLCKIANLPNSENQH